MEIKAPEVILRNENVVARNVDSLFDNTRKASKR
jgi:hypothetical protein